MPGEHRGLGSPLATAVAAVLACIVGGLSIVGLIASWKGDQAREGWKRTLGSPEALLLRFPPREANPAALQLETQAAALGIDIATRMAEGRARPTRASGKSYPAKELGEYLSAQLKRSGPGVDSPPAALASFLEQHRAEIDVLSRGLAGPTPLWELNIQRLREAPVPNLMGHLHLQKLLIADALAAVASNSSDRALTALDASFQLNRALRDDPIVITQLVALSAARMEAGALRRIARVPTLWRERLAEHDYRASMTTALEVEGWSWTQAPPTDLKTSSSFVRNAVATVGVPYMKLCASDISEAFRRRVEQLSRLDAWWDDDAAASSLDLQVAGWNVLGPLLASNFQDVVPRLARLEIDLELTGKLLQLQEAREAAGGVWPAEVSGIERSQACPHDRWVYEVAPEGGMSLAFSRDPKWPDSSGLSLPTRYAEQGAR